MLATGAARKSAIVTTTALRLSMLLMSLSDDDDNWVNEEYNLECVCGFAFYGVSSRIGHG